MARPFNTTNLDHRVRQKLSPRAQVYRRKLAKRAAFVSGESERETWTATLAHEDGKTLELRVSPLASGASLILLDPMPAISALNLGHMLAHDNVQHSSTAAA